MFEVNEGAPPTETLEIDLERRRRKGPLKTAPDADVKKDSLRNLRDGVDDKFFRVCEPRRQETKKRDAEIEKIETRPIDADRRKRENKPRGNVVFSVSRLDRRRRAATMF